MNKYNLKWRVKRRRGLSHIYVWIMALAGLTSCKPPLVIDTISNTALAAGQATMILGGCSRPMAVGYDSCMLTKGAKLPKLQMGFLGPSEYAISDCKMGIYKTGSSAKAGLIEVDLEPLSEQINKNGFCILRVEAYEYYPDNNDPGQKHAIPLVGGWFIEMLDPGFLPSFTPSIAGWCYVVQRTTQGRTMVAPCR